MFKKILDFLKPIVSAFIVLALLQVTGLLGGASFIAQTALMKTGINDASSKPIKKPVDFDYGFMIKTMKGEQIKFDTYKGKVVFLNLWATWCGPCRVEMPSIQSLYSKIDTTGIAFVMLSIDRDSDKPKITRYIEKNQFSFPVFQPSGYLTAQLNVPSIPTTFIISKEGKIVSKEIGATNFDTEKFRKFLVGLKQ